MKFASCIFWLYVTVEKLFISYLYTAKETIVVPGSFLDERSSGFLASGRMAGKETSQQRESYPESHLSSSLFAWI